MTYHMRFSLQSKLARIFRKGILKAARSTDAWIITSGLNTGVVPHVASALEDLGSTSRSRTRVIAIGVAPWGMLKRRNRFIGTDKSVHYATNQFNKSRLAELNDRHSYFLFADNGTVGSTPRIPVVVCDGSGRAADLLAFTHHAIGDDGAALLAIAPPMRFKQQGMLAETVNIRADVEYCDTVLSRKLTDSVRNQLMSLVEMMTVFRLGEQRQEVDHAILTALLKGQNLSSPEQLQLAPTFLLSAPDLSLVTMIRFRNGVLKIYTTR
ncbi:hypothetical protein TELCIR_19652 [Teladorsagia circumcincta]|uniref:TRPM SLOG domain-containing protein n=1 Tax=Teladorsagia circumcincta TaxID=45464 RepID=A0A2G9TLQ5_TELCI|nr:hypothetical protein TELCIR_19652 [Teladorsagia circumcincta]